MKTPPNALAILLAAAAVVACSADAPQSTSPVADTVFTNAKVYTVDEGQPWAEAVAVKDGKFVAVGSNSEIEAMVGDGTKTVDLSGKIITSGFIDTHFHSVAASIITAEFDTGAEPTNEGMYARLREFATTQEGRTEPLITYGWHLANFPKQGPVQEDLDEIFPDYSGL